jgi:hypothetical protein
MAFTEDKTITVNPIWMGRINSQYLLVEHREDIHHRENRPDVGALRATDHFQDPAPDAICKSRR